METKQILKYRNIWMALAIIWIIIFHSEVDFGNSLFNYIRKISYGGVDIFFFASGIGCFYSFIKDNDILNFIKRRFLKIMPTYWCFIVIWLVVINLIDNKIPFFSIIGNIFCIENFTGKGNDFNWYISALWLFYILTPLMAKIVCKINSNKNMFISVIVLILFSISFWDSNTLIITISRIPIFFLGMCFAKKFKEIEKVSYKYIVMFAIFMIIGFVMLFIFITYFNEYLWCHALYWYPFILITPGLCILMSILFKLIDNFNIGKKINKLLLIVGNNTFQIYLIHIMLFMINDKLKIFNNWVILLLILPSTILFKYYFRFIKFICKKIYCCFKSRG